MFRRFSNPSILPFVFYADDDGTNAGANNDAGKSDDAANGDDAGKQSGSAAITFASEKEFQKRVDDMLKDRLAREEQKRTKAADDARAKAEAEALAKNQEWQKLAETNAKRLAELEPLAEQVEAHQAEVERYRDALNAQLDAQRKDIPAPIIALLDRMDPIEQMKWIAENREAIVGKDGKTIIKASPNGAGSLSRDELVQQEIAAQRRSGRYGI